MTDDQDHQQARRRFSWASLTFGEAEILEDLTGQPIEDLLEHGVRGAKALKAVAYIVARRDNPDVTVDDVDAMHIITSQPDAPSSNGDSPDQEDDVAADPPVPAAAASGQ